MSSLDIGKDIVKSYIESHWPDWKTILDVGACDGKWRDIIDRKFEMDAVEIWEPNVRNHDLKSKYRQVINDDVRYFAFDWYDVVIYGDVIEHMTVESAQKELEYARNHSHEVIVAVPYRYKQGPIYGNPYEEHIQDDLTHELFMQRYPGFKVLYQTSNYCYYVKDVM